jgi:hypothetical protein
VITDHYVQSSGTLAAGTGAQLAAPSPPLCLMAIVANNGVNPMVVKFGSMPTSATDGIPLDPASTAGGQGGSITLTDDQVSQTDAIFGYSTLGTTFAVLQATSHT